MTNKNISPEKQKEWDEKLEKLENNELKLKYTSYDTYVKVQIRKAPEKSAGGIVLPDKARQYDELNTEKGILVDYSPLAWEEVLNRHGKIPKIGDVVIFKKHCGRKIEENDRLYRIMQDVDVYGTLVEE